jgi:SNF2 family DNA or RNA helicase
MEAFNPRPYQLDAIKRGLALPAFALFLDPGMGKTSSTLEIVRELIQSKQHKSALVIAPIRPARYTWPAETQKWAQFNNLRVSLVLGSLKQRRAALRAPAEIYVINPENVQWLYDELAAEQDPAARRQWFTPTILVVDESTKFKNPQAKRFKALKDMLPLFKRRYILTGAPAPQSLQDLWSQVYLLDAGARLGRSITAFRKRFFDEVIPFPGASFSEWVLREGADVEIFDRIAPLSIRLDSREHLAMPELVINKVDVELPEGAARVYAKLERDFVAGIADGKVTAANAAAASMKLRQIANGTVYYTDEEAGQGGAVGEVHDAKIEALVDLVEEQSGQPLLVAVAFKHEVVRIREAIGGDVPYLGGGVPTKEADDIIASWNRGEIPVLLAHPTSVAHGLNLQSGGHSLAWFGLSWSLEEYIQMNGRVWRQGQKSPMVIVHHIIARNTIDEAIVAALDRKDATQAGLFATLKRYANGKQEGAARAAA